MQGLGFISEIEKGNEIMVLIILTVMAFLIGYSLGMAYPFKKDIDESELITKEYLTKVSEQLKQNVCFDLRGAINGVRKFQDKYYADLKDIVSPSLKQMKLPIEVETNQPTIAVLLDPRPEIYHSQNVRIGNQNLESLREHIDSLWQDAYIRDLSTLEIEKAYERLGKIHRCLSAVVEKVKRGYKI